MDPAQSAAAPAQAPAAPALPDGAPAPAAPAPATPAAQAPAAPAPLALGELQAAPAPATPAAAPAAPAAVVYEATGDAGLDLALDFVGKLGFGPDHAAIQAASNGDFTALKAALAADPKAAGFERYLALAEQSFGRQADKAAARQASDREAIHKVVGGEEAWGAIQAWATEQTADSPEQRAEVNAALAAGGMQAKAMAAYLANLHAAAAGTVVTPAARVQAPGSAGAAPTATPLTAQQFADESRALRARLGYDFEQSAEFRSLVVRRESARRAGK